MIELEHICIPNLGFFKHVACLYFTHYEHTKNKVFVKVLVTITIPEKQRYSGVQKEESGV